MAERVVRYSMDLGVERPAVHLRAEGVEFIALGPMAGGAAAMCLADYVLMLEGGPAQIFSEPMPAGSVVVVDFRQGSEPETMDVDVGGRAVTFTVRDLLKAGALLGKAGTVH